MDKDIKKIAKDFRNSMQELSDKHDTTISVKMNDGDWKTISEPKNQQLKTKTMQKFETLNILCKLTDDEMLAISKEMSEHINKKKGAEDDLASFSAQKKAEIKGHDGIINRSSLLISTGSEYRNIKCEVVIDEKHNKVNWIRQGHNGNLQHRKSYSEQVFTEGNGTTGIIIFR